MERYSLYRQTDALFI